MKFKKFEKVVLKKVDSQKVVGKGTDDLAKWRK